MPYICMLCLYVSNEHLYSKLCPKLALVLHVLHGDTAKRLGDSNSPTSHLKIVNDVWTALLYAWDVALLAQHLC